MNYSGGKRGPSAIISESVRLWCQRARRHGETEFPDRGQFTKLRKTTEMSNVQCYTALMGREPLGYSERIRAAGKEQL